MFISRPDAMSALGEIFTDVNKNYDNTLPYYLDFWRADKCINKDKKWLLKNILIFVINDLRENGRKLIF